MSETPPPADETATVHAHVALKPDGRIDPDSVRPTVEKACHDASALPVLEVEVSLAKPT